MAGQTRKEKSTWWPRPHDMRFGWFHGLETAANNAFTIMPLSFYDEGLGAPSTYESHPENAAFVEAAEANCFVDSRIDSITAIFRFDITKGALETDKIHAIRGFFMPMSLSFEDTKAVDELSSLEIEDTLELQTESTDRQCFPLYNAVDMVERVAGSALMPTNQPGLT